jgi:hypothetical protein
MILIKKEREQATRHEHNISLIQHNISSFQEYIKINEYKLNRS